MLEKFFRLKEHGTNIRTELLAGTTTFMTMAYIIFFQPALFHGAMGMDYGAVMMATCISSALSTLLMGLWANYPVALAPGMGENFFFVSVATTTGVALAGMKVTWKMAMAAVFICGIIVMILTFLQARKAIIHILPPSITHAIAAGIGAFIAFIGLNYSGIVVRNPAGLVKLGDLKSPITLLSVGGFLVICLLMMWRIRGGNRDRDDSNGDDRRGTEPHRIPWRRLDDAVHSANIFEARLGGHPAMANDSGDPPLRLHGFVR